MMTSAERQALIAELRALPDQLETLVSGLTAEQLHTPFLQGEWTVAQNVHHVADSHMHAYIRTKLMLTKDHPTLTPYDQDVWATLPDMRTVPISVSITLLRALHTRWAALFEGLSDAEYARTGLHPDNGEVSVEGQLTTYVNHGKGHLDQITRTLAAQPHSA
ncbi:MAG: putative metal-dependent hydrolase [Anaerolineae bacterium]